MPHKNTTPVAPLLGRNLYKTIKRMDRDTLQGLIQDIYESGRKKGLSEAGIDEPADAAHTLDQREKYDLHMTADWFVSDHLGTDEQYIRK